jgi:hypothetical protein
VFAFRQPEPGSRLDEQALDGRCFQGRQGSNFRWRPGRDNDAKLSEHHHFGNRDFSGAEILGTETSVVQFPIVQKFPSSVPFPRIPKDLYL